MGPDAQDTTTLSLDLHRRGKITFKNEVERLSIFFQSDAAGESVQLSVQKALGHLPIRNCRTASKLKRSLARHAWSPRSAFNSMPHRDGVLLRDTTSDHGASYDLVAVKLDRAPVELDVVLPPARLFVRASWWIPD